MAKYRLAGLFLLCLAVLLGAPGTAFADNAALLSGLSSADSDKRLDAIEALGQARAKQAVEPLIALLKAPKTPAIERMYAAYALGQIGDSRAVAPLIEMARRDMTARTGVIMAAIPALGMLGDARAVPLLLEALQNREEDWLAREVSAEALGSIGSREAVPALINAAWMADTRTPALVALSRIGDPRSTEVFISALDQEEDTEVREAALEGLRKTGKASLPQLLAALDDHGPEYPNTAKRLMIIEVLAGLDCPEAREALQNAAEDTDPEISAAAEKALNPAP